MTYRTTQQTKELNRELVEVKQHILTANTVQLPEWSSETKANLQRLIKYLELRRDTIEQKLARMKAQA